jgi:hypothetical protein
VFTKVRPVRNRVSEPARSARSQEPHKENRGALEAQLKRTQFRSPPPSADQPTIGRVMVFMADIPGSPLRINPVSALNLLSRRLIQTKPLTLHGVYSFTAETIHRRISEKPTLFVVRSSSSSSASTRRGSSFRSIHSCCMELGPNRQIPEPLLVDAGAIGKKLGGLLG